MLFVKKNTNFERRRYEIAFCVNCGYELKEGAKFCTNCGSTIIPHKKADTNERKAFYDGEIHKCPSCGEVLPSFVGNCPSCGYELRGNVATNSVKELYWELCRTTTEVQKNNMIRNFPIPNSKEDILEFMILASSNILGEDNQDIYEAWLAKFEQAYQKSVLLFSSETDFIKIQRIYENCQSNIHSEKQRKFSKVTVDTVVRNIAVCVGMLLFFVAIVIDRSHGNSSLVEIAAYIILIASASSLVKRGAIFLDYAVSAGSGLLTILLSFFLYNGSMAELCGAIVLIIVAVNYFKSLGKSKK